MKKYAIFQRDDKSLYGVRYIDTIEDAPPYVREDQLPCLINSRGGLWSNFDGKIGYDDNQCVGIRTGENIRDVLTFEEKYPSSNICGYIGPTGDWYPCRYEGHEELANDICFYILNKSEDEYSIYSNPQLYLEKLGYIKIMTPYGNGKIRLGYDINKGFTKAQCDKLFELGFYEKSYEIRELIKYWSKKNNF